MILRLEYVDDRNRDDVLRIDRSDISEDWVDSIPAILDLHQYGLDHSCIGHTYAVYADDICIGIILMGEGIPWPCDPPEIAGVPFYRIMGFVLDMAWRGRGLGSQVLETVIARIFDEFGPRPILIGVQAENLRAADFYLRHGFSPTEAWDEDDRFYIRYPAKEEPS